MSIYDASEETGAPTSPSASRQLLYPKSTGWHKKTSAGVETRLADANDIAGRSPRGTLVVPMTSSDVTLTATQFDNVAFDITGTLTANVNLIIPDSISQLFIIDNETTGAFTITVKHSATAGVVAPQGSRVVMYTNGTVVEGVTAVGGGTGSVTASGVANTPAGGIASTNVQAAINELDTEKAAIAGTLGQFAATTSAQLAGVISDETGSGALVFATSPTLVTPALDTPTSGTLTNCTGLPQAGTVGLTTADSPQFTGVNVGHATDTTLTRASAGTLAVEGVNMLTTATGAALAGSASQAFAALTLDIGHASDTTLSRVSAGTAAIEGSTILTSTASQVIQATRDMTAASGNVSYTGVGFTPKCIMIDALIDTSTATSNGMSTGITEYGKYKAGGAATAQNIMNALVVIATDAGITNYQLATVQSLNADGFTLTWNKIGSPTGTMYMNIIAFK